MSTPPPSAATAGRAPFDGAREAWLALAVGAVLYRLSFLLQAPGTEAVGFGLQWELMSADPLSFPGQLPHRILTPLLAHVCGFGGAPLYALFTRGLSVVLLATVFFFCRRRGASRGDALLVTAAIAVVAPVQMYKICWVGYCDPLTYSLFFWAWLAADRPVRFWVLFFLNLLNHELAAFLLPWLWFLRRQAGGSWRADAVGAGTALGAYAVYYLAVRAASTPTYTYDYFVANPLFPGGSFAVMVLALVHWTVAFGPVLAVLAFDQHRPAPGRQRLHLWLVLLGIAAIFCIAFDWNRHSHLIVLPLVPAALRFVQAGFRPAFAGLAALGVGLMWRWSPWPAKSWPTWELSDPAFAHGVVLIRPEGVQFGPLSAAVTRWLPAVWPTLQWILLILAAIWATGALFARWRNPGRDDSGAAVR